VTAAPLAASPSPQIERKLEIPGLRGRRRWGAMAATAALVILVAAYAGSKAWEHLRGPAVESPSGPSILVLPFQNMGGDPAQDFVARGLTFEIINFLTRYSELFVYGLETSLGAVANSPEASRADYVVSASVQSASNKVKVSAILSESRTGRTVWSQGFERDLTTASLLDIESDIAGQVASAIAQPYGIVFNRTAAEIASKPARNLRSYECVVRFRQQWRQYDPRDYEDMRDCLEQTIRVDPNYARAYSSLALLDIDSYRFGFGKDKIAVDPLREALELSQKSLELDPDNTEAYLSLMMTYWFMHDPGKSVEIAERGLALNPHDTDLLAELGFRYALMEKWDRSRPLIAEAFARNPKTPSGYRLATFHYYYMHGEYRAALAEILQVKAPFILYGHVCRAMAYAQLGDQANAAAAVAEILKIDPNYGEQVEADLAKRGNSSGIIRAAIEGLSKAGLKIGPQ
jgi:adenylate cyclase